MYQLELQPDKKRVFVTQLRDSEDEEEFDGVSHVQKIPIVKQGGGTLVEYGYNTTQKTLLLKRKHDAAALHTQLDKRKTELVERIKTSKEKELIFKEKQSNLKSRKEKFEKFIDENNKKKERAWLKFKKEEIEKLSKVEKLAHIKSELILLDERCRKLEEKIITHKKFHDFLNNVIDKLPEDYLELGDNMNEKLMKKYETLEESHNLLIGRIETNNSTINEYSNQLVDLSSNTSQKIAIYNKEISSLSLELSNMQLINSKKEQLIETKHHIHRRYSENIGKIKLAVENLAQICGIEDNKLSLSQKLHKIQIYFQERESVLKFCMTD